MAVRKIPMRMCVGCRNRRPKKELIRVVRLASDGTIRLDPTGKASGRGAYLCLDNPDCLKKAVKSRALERILEAQVEDSVFEGLNAQMERWRLMHPAQPDDEEDEP